MAWPHLARSEPGAGPLLIAATIRLAPRAALSRLLLVSKRYPESKANQNFLSLQAQLEGTENRISVERGNFNKTVQDYNVAVRSFPTNLIAGMLGFPPKPFFTAQAGAEKPPPVQFNFNSPAPAPAATP